MGVDLARSVAEGRDTKGCTKGCTPHSERGVTGNPKAADRSCS